MKRCEWCGDDPLYMSYHDQEWGVPVYDDRRLFEFLTLESAQAGLSWITVLRKRENYRSAFCDFAVEQVAKFGSAEISTLLNNPGIIRNRAKVAAAVTNAQAFIAVQKEFGSFSAYAWQFVGGKPIVNRWRKLGQVPASTKEAEVFSKDLKKRGFKFVGPTIIYAHMQACGMVNDHVVDCFRHKELLP